MAENPVRHGTLPQNIVEVGEGHSRCRRGAIRDERDAHAGFDWKRVARMPRANSVDRSALRSRSGSRQRSTSSGLARRVRGGERLIRRGARIDLPVAAALGRIEDFRRLLPGASARTAIWHSALAAQFGHVEIVRLLLDAGEDPDRYNPVGGHSHSTPLHQAAGAGHDEVVRLLVERGARLNLKDVLWRATPADWARHAGRTEIEAYLRSKMGSEKRELLRSFSAKRRRLRMTGGLEQLPAHARVQMCRRDAATTAGGTPALRNKTPRLLAGARAELRAV